MTQQMSLWDLLDTPRQEAPTAQQVAAVLTAAERKYLQGPIIQPPTGWPFPQRLRNLVHQDRMAVILSGEDALASDVEALGYISCMSQAAPITSDWANIMFVLLERVAARYGWFPGQSVSEMLDMPVGSLTKDQERALRQLKRDIRQSVVKHFQKTNRK